MSDTTYAIHPKNKILDVQTISKITWLISRTERAVPDFKAHDSWPNTDGTVDLLENIIEPKNKVIGFLTVQIKKLEDGQKTPTYSFDNDKFLNYCKDHGDVYPIILIGVALDKDKSVAYWEHIDSSYLSKLAGKKTINFDTNKIIDETSDKFVDDWIAIYARYKDRFADYLKLKQSYDTLVSLIPSDYGKTDPIFTRIHDFLDEYNHLLDYQLKIVKDRLYPFAWKIGFAYENYSPSEITYTLYPIPINKNDIQIKKIDANTAKKIREEASRIVGMSRENPIEENPKRYAKELIIEDLQKLIEGKALNNSINQYLANEFIFAFIDEFYQQLGLEKKNEYSLWEITLAFYEYLPAWVNETITIITKKNKEQIQKFTTNEGYFDPSSLLGYLSTEDKKLITKKLSDPKVDLTKLRKPWPIGNTKLGFGMFSEMLDYLRNTNTDETQITRIYKKRTSSERLDGFTQEDLEFNIRSLFRYFPQVYKDFLLANFPMLESKFALLGDATLLLYATKFSRHGEKDQAIMMYLKSTTTEKINEIKVSFDNQSFEQYRQYNLGDTIIVNNIPYHIISISHGLLGGYVFRSDTPMLDFIYSILKERVKKYTKVE